MNGQQLSMLLAGKQSVKAQQVHEIERLVKRYPYFQAARLLTARAKQDLQHPDARKNRSIASLYATDQRLFKTFMASKKKPAPTPTVSTKSALSASKKKVTESPTPRLSYTSHALKSKKMSHQSPPTAAASAHISASMGDIEREQLLSEVMEQLRDLRQNKDRYVSDEDSRERRHHDYVQKTPDTEPPPAITSSAVEETPKKPTIPDTAPESTAEQRAREASLRKEIERLRALQPQEESRPPTAHPATATAPIAPTPPHVSPLHSSSPVQVIFGNQPTPTQAAPQYPYAPPPNPFPYVYAAPMPPPYTNYYSPPPPYVMPTQYPFPAQTPIPQEPLPPAIGNPPSGTTPSSPPRPARTMTTDTQDDQQALIDRFVKKFGNQSDEEKVTKKNPASAQNTALSNQSEGIKEDICSEELAELYLNQGHTARAIEIYHRLCEKYPDKSAYFVRKIREIKE